MKQKQLDVGQAGCYINSIPNNVKQKKYSRMDGKKYKAISYFRNKGRTLCSM
ncbi:hypothetical protein [Radiobacillus sp. PE A8.2]|uniref:hypothetical protein n=1 Tax=Radiobacillus sp. PE A8.2 TaxID=3380349 RepID=UPI00388D80F5